MQEYLEHKNEDFRILTCKDEIICAAKRKGQSWITNVHQGAQPEKIRPSEEMAEMALKASHVLGCHYCGIDILESRGELYIIEANGSPDMNVHQPVEDFDIASKVVELLG
jgi:glutathione synthase/RimK-type ligase-like ATP-grasp enzyme